MAKKKAEGPSKSDEIRKLLSSHPEMGPTAICAELKGRGISVTPGLVSNVKKAMLGGKPLRKKKRVKKKSAGKRVTSVAASRGGDDKVSLSALVEARDFAQKVGGVDKAAAILRALSKLG